LGRGLTIDLRLTFSGANQMVYMFFDEKAAKDIKAPEGYYKPSICLTSSFNVQPTCVSTVRPILTLINALQFWLLEALLIGSRWTHASNEIWIFTFTG
jgi:hypothetical protein